MAKLAYINNVSLDGYVEDPTGALDWAPPDEEVLAATTDLMRSFGTYLYGRRLYEAMAVWETDPSIGAQSDLTAEFARVWGAADKVVYSRTLSSVPTARTQLERRFDPEAVRRSKDAATSDLVIGGADLAGQAFGAGVLDDCHLLLWPMILGGGKPALPAGGHVDLDLVDERRFDNGVVHLHYAVRT